MILVSQADLYYVNSSNVPVKRTSCPPPLKLSSNICFRKRTVVYVAFEEPTGPAWMTQISNIQTVRGLKPLNERLANSPHGPKSGLRPLSAILKDIQGSLSASTPYSRIFALTATESQTSLVIIDCITPVFREPSLDPIHFLGSVLSLQRTTRPYHRVLTLL